jgi:hypothetical protein
VINQNMSENDESLSGAEIADLARRLFGPEEEWDDAAAEFVLRLHGIDPGDSGDEIAYGIKLILNVIERQKKQDKEVPRELTTILQKLTAERDRDPRINEAQNQLEKAMRAGAGAGRQVATKLRRTGKLSAEDEEILKQLEAKLLAESKDD